MKLFPYQDIVITSHRSADYLRGQLRLNVEQGIASPFFRYNPGTKLFTGNVDSDSFIIHRKISYRNSFLPRITGQLIKNEEGAIVHIQLRLDMAVQILLFIFIMLPVLVSLTMMFFASDSFSLGSLTFPMFAYLICYLGFRYEARKAIPLLEDIFDTESTELKGTPLL